MRPASHRSRRLTSPPDEARDSVSAPCADTVGRLRCLRGIDTLSVLGLCTEIGEWSRFDHPDQLTSYLGIVAVAIARELADYCWEIATWAPHPDPVASTSVPTGDPSRTQPRSHRSTQDRGGAPQ